MLPRLIPTRSVPVGARLLTTSGETVAMALPCDDGAVLFCANAAPAASAKNRVAVAVVFLIVPSLFRHPSRPHPEGSSSHSDDERLEGHRSRVYPRSALIDAQVGQARLAWRPMWRRLYTWPMVRDASLRDAPHHEAEKVNHNVSPAP